MPAWLPWLKAAAPYLTQALPHLVDMISRGRPIFTKKRAADPVYPVVVEGEVVPTVGLLSNQISELQMVAIQNADYIKNLAEQLQKTIVAQSDYNTALEKRLKRMNRVLWLGFAVMIGVMVYLWRTHQ